MQEIVEKFCSSQDVSSIEGLELPRDSFSFEDPIIRNLKKIKTVGNYKVLDLSFLTMRDKDNNPKFAVFTSNSESCFLQVSVEARDAATNITIATNFASKCIRTQFLDMYRKLVTDNRSLILPGQTTTLKMRSKFSGIVPKEYRALLSSDKCFDEKVLIAEATNWAVKDTVVKHPPNPDPLIVGIKDDVAYLLAAFDMTVLENYASSEWLS